MALTNRGGRHKGTLKPTWNAGKTTSIRIPESKKAEIKAILRTMDLLNWEFEIVPLATMEVIREKLKEGATIPANKAGRLKEIVRELTALLEP
jgi:hypothetical protein